MYTRQTANARTPKMLKVPPNYGGSTFYNITDTSVEDPDRATAETEPQEYTAPSEIRAEDVAAATMTESPRAGLFHGFGGSSGGIGLEELLILGLALLISQNDVGDDLAFLLLLLVFIK